MSKKERIAISIDRDVLRELDDYVREMQKEDLQKNRPLTSRSEVVEQFVRECIKRQ